MKKVVFHKLSDDELEDEVFKFFVELSAHIQKIVGSMDKVLAFSSHELATMRWTLAITRKLLSEYVKGKNLFLMREKDSNKS